MNGKQQQFIYSKLDETSLWIQSDDDKANIFPIKCVVLCVVLCIVSRISKQQRFDFRLDFVRRRQGQYVSNQRDCIMLYYECANSRDLLIPKLTSLWIQSDDVKANQYVFNQRDSSRFLFFCLLLRCRRTLSFRFRFHRDLDLMFRLRFYFC